VRDGGEPLHAVRMRLVASEALERCGSGAFAQFREGVRGSRPHIRNTLLRFLNS
jgi:hypothetical protein